MQIPFQATSALVGYLYWPHIPFVHLYECAEERRDQTQVDFQARCGSAFILSDDWWVFSSRDSTLTTVWVKLHLCN